ncbi:MAG: hypothetical protein J6B01_04665 [Ruminococcus sp.]|nr:hypothetical protein [Ruminococcus sp.]
MVDWLRSMQQTFEYYVVDPKTWKDIRKIDNVKSSSISWDSEAETLGSASFDIMGSLDECYIRIYLITIQNGIREKHPLGTFLMQTPSTNFDGKSQSISMDAYTPLLELKEKLPPIGYTINKGDQIIPLACNITSENVRAPVVTTTCDESLDYNFVANTNDTWLTFLRDLIANAKYSFMLDELGRILFSPKQEMASLQPIWTFNDDNSSILYSDITVNRDLYGIPNVVEVIYSNGNTYNEKKHRAVVKNEDSNSPVSIINRGREIVHRVTNPEMTGVPDENRLKEYANQLLRELSSLEYTVKYTHGYCPIRIGDCVRLNYKRAGINGVKAKVISQSIKCEPGCPVTETAVFVNKLWG